MTQNELGSLTVDEILIHRASSMPDKVAYGFRDAQLRLTEITYKELVLAVEQYAYELGSLEIKHGDRCMLIFPQKIEFIIALLACHKLGVIPIPLNVPGRNKPLDKWEKIANDCTPVAILTEASNYDFLVKTLKGSPVLKTVNVWRLDGNFSEKASLNTNYHEIAFLQYTSGSTGDPKGVMVTHDSLWNNLKQAKTALSFEENSIVVTWLPFYHDMGLILGILEGLYTGCTVIMMQPHHFMSHPLDWFRIVALHKATHTISPNFGYELMAEKLEQLDEVSPDLSLDSLEYVLCGAEPIHLKTLRRFQTAAAKFGLSEAALIPGYGLAEATLIVSTYKQDRNLRWLTVTKQELQKDIVNVVPTEIDDDREDIIHLVSNGKVLDEHLVSIREPNSNRALNSYEIGEICFGGPSVTRGYWNNTEATESTFVLFDGTRFLRTGDLGFKDENGELYITGRIKDLIIIRGLNHYPQDIERTAFKASESLRDDGTAAFSVNHENGEKLVIVQELQRSAIREPNYREWVSEIQQEVLRHHGIIAEEILFVPPLHVPRTTSGKIQRRRAKILYEESTWPRVLFHYERERILFNKPKGLVYKSDIEEYLIALFADQLQIPGKQIKKSQPFTEMGVNSMMSLWIRESIETALSIDINSSAMFNYNTIDLLSTHIINALDAPVLTTNENSDLEIGDTPLQQEETEEELLERLKKELNQG